MKYHIHVHSLITFGGLDENGKWQWPKRKKKIAPYREMCKRYREIFLSMLKEEISAGKIEQTENLEGLLEKISTKRWNVRNEFPTANTEILERYLSRYINRVAISKSRLSYVCKQEEQESYVEIRYKNYRKQKTGKAAPMATMKLEPLSAIHQFMLHVLPAYFQKTRYYGLHASATYKKIKQIIPKELKRNTETVLTLFAILRYLNDIPLYQCKQCQHDQFEIKPVGANEKWIYYFITIPLYRGPPREYGKTVII